MSVCSLRVVGAGTAAAIAVKALHLYGGCESGEPETSAAAGLSHYVTLNEPTLFLIREMFGHSVVELIHRRSNLLGERIVAWDGSEVHRIPAPGVLISTDDLADCLEATDNDASANEAEHLTLFARGRKHNDGQPVGSRFGFQWDGLPDSPTDRAIAYTVAVEGGWGMYAGTPGPGATLQVVVPAGAPAAQEIAERVLHALQQLGALKATDIASCSLGATRAVQVAPQLSTAFKSGVLALGDELMALDPLSGDGIGHCLRTAVLYAAFASRYGLQSLVNNPSVADRINTAFIHHLLNCERFYMQIHHRQIWDQVIAEMHNRRIELGAASSVLKGV